jgi:hypothetical protein
VDNFLRIVISARPNEEVDEQPFITSFLRENTLRIFFKSNDLEGFLPPPFNASGNR